MLLTQRQCKHIGERPGAVEHEVKLGSAGQTEESRDRGAELPPHLPLHVPQRSDHT